MLNGSKWKIRRTTPWEIQVIIASRLGTAEDYLAEDCTIGWWFQCLGFCSLSKGMDEDVPSSSISQTSVKSQDNFRFPVTHSSPLHPLGPKKYEMFHFMGLPETIPQGCYITSILPIAFCFAVSLILSNLAYKYCTVAFLQMIKEGLLAEGDRACRSKPGGGCIKGDRVRKSMCLMYICLYNYVIFIYVYIYYAYTHIYLYL